MEGFEEKLGSVLSNPQMMQQIMDMANALNQTDTPPDPAPPSDPTPFGELDPAMLQKIIGLTAHTGIDRNQTDLLGALRPYLSSQRLQKLEKAMRAAKLARMATAAMNSGALNFLTGR